MSLYSFMGFQETEIWRPGSKESVRAYLGVLRDAEVRARKEALE